ncbi:MAG: HlyD family efflux transporter periplasmic adaptor subunit [Clostridia bacterium]|nr:HlyD family efflux transporter periplasmic adaptor subunit [Clostridia bacterium]
MKNRFIRKFLPLMTAGLLLASSAASAASSVELDGKVVNTSPVPVTVSYTGTVDTLPVFAGENVTKGQTIATLKTTKVYATVSGTVRLFGKAGDSAETVAGHYGAVAYIEPDVKYYLSSSTGMAYDAEENSIVHPGEMVYLRGAKHLDHKGTGMVTGVDGTGFTVDVLTGNFETDEYVYSFRKENYAGDSRIGRGRVKRTEFTALSGSGIIVRANVENGSHVNAGDVLFETVEGDFSGYAASLTEVKAPADGIVSEVSVSMGSSVTAGDAVATLYPKDAMRVEASVSEENLRDFPAGTAVQVTFPYVGDGSQAVSGVVERVSQVGADDESDNSDESFFTVLIRLDSTDNISYGMTATVTKK